MTVEGQTDHICHIRSIRTIINYCIFKCQVLETNKKKTLEYNSYLNSWLWSKGHKKKYVALIHGTEMRYKSYNIFS